MTWLHRYQVRRFVQNALWLLPVLSMAGAMVAVRAAHWADTLLGWEAGVNADTARALLGTLASSMFTFIVFVCSALLVAVQLASAQLTPRIIALVFNDPVTKSALALFVFTFTFSLSALVRVGDSVPRLTTEVAAYSCLASLGAFLYLIDHVGKWLRPSGAVRSVGLLAREVIESMYPRHLSEPVGDLRGHAEAIGAPARTVLSPKDGVVLAFDLRGLVAQARRADCVIELVPQVGDHIAAGDPLFRVYRGGDRLPEGALCHSVAVGQERTLEQDPAFAFRILVDISSKGLSPAINDPTTAVLAIDQIHHLLRNLGGRHLDTGMGTDATGQLRLVYRTPGWEDFVRLAVTEARQFGAESIQIARRLRAMLEDLIETLPEHRAGLLRQELNLLHRSAERSFPEPEDRSLANVSDPQGVGGTHGGRGGEPHVA